MKLRTVLPARRSSIDAARRAVLGGLPASGLTPELVYRLELVMEEVLMNIIWHAYGDSGQGKISVEAQREGDEIKLVFEDDGPPFDPTQVAPTPMPDKIEDVSSGGLGLVLLPKFATSIAYERVEARNRLEVVVRG